MMERGVGLKLKSALRKRASRWAWQIAEKIISRAIRLKLHYLGWPYTPGETAKAKPRRLKEGFFKKYCQGWGLDIGYGGDLVSRNCFGWELEHGDGQYLRGIEDEAFDFVYASHILEHMPDPRIALRNWWRVLKPGGFLIVSVPERDLYEKKKTLPSKRNLDHKSFFLLDKDEKPDTIGLVSLMERFLKRIEVVYGRIYNGASLGSGVEDGECSIEVVAMKKKTKKTKKTLKFKKDYGLILPTFKEKKNLEKLIPDLLLAFKEIKRKVEIIVVDDASDDGTRELLRRLRRKGQPVRLIERRKEKGPFSAVVRGTDEVEAFNIIHMDSDRVHEIDDLKQMIALYERGQGKQVIIGSRYLRESAYYGKPILNKMASRLGGLIVNYYVKLPIKDASNNFRIFTKEAWQQIRSQLVDKGNVGFIHVLVLLKRYGYQLMEVPTTYIEKRVGQSSLRKHLREQTIRFFKDLPLLRRSLSSTRQN